MISSDRNDFQRGRTAAVYDCAHPSCQRVSRRRRLIRAFISDPYSYAPDPRREDVVQHGKHGAFDEPRNEAEYREEDDGPDPEEEVEHTWVRNTTRVERHRSGEDQ